jgi:hypothetical protein
MRARPSVLRGARATTAGLALVLGLAGLSACTDTLPQKIALRPDAGNVEILSEPPNREVYEAVGEVSAQVIGHEVGDAMRSAFNQLRNQASAKGATFVGIEEVTSRAAWDFSGRTIVTLVGTAYRPK